MADNRHKSSGALVLLAIMLILFVSGMVGLVGLRLTFQNATDSLNNLASNERVRQEIGNHVASEINSMESVFFQLAPVSGLYELNIMVDKFRQQLANVGRDLDILEKGGLFESSTALNAPDSDNISTVLVYKPDPDERYILASIELRPQLPELENRLEVLVNLLEERTRLGKIGDAEAYFKQIKEIQTNLRIAIPMFHRLKETANNLLYDSALRLKDLETVISARKRDYEIIESATYISFIFVIGALGIFIAKRIRDVIRNERESDEELRRAGIFLNTILESLTHPFCVIDLNTCKIEISNPAAKAEFGESTSSDCCLMAFNDQETLDKQKFDTTLEQIKKTGSSASSLETKGPDGKIRYFDHRAYPVYDEDRKITKLIQYWIDVTDRKQVEQERMMLAAAVEQSEEAIVIASPNGETHYVNPAFEISSGYSKIESIGENFLKINGFSKDEALCREILDNLNKGSSWKGKITSSRKDGTSYEEAVLISPITDDDGLITNLVTIKRDISVEVELEKQMRHSQKMEAVGTLAGGIAHDFNNLLQIILGYSDMLLDERDPDARDSRKLKAIRKAASNGADLVKQLLTFSRKSPVSLESIDLNTELLRIADLLYRTIPRMIDIRMNLDENLHIIELDPIQFEQVILNLATNARDAMPDGGILLIQTGNAYLDEKFCQKYSSLNPGEYIVIKVSDNGHGMDIKTAGHIFEPFFSTKEVGKGTGLGLSTVFGIVKAHGGHIICESEVGIGTTFSIYLPTSQELLKHRQKEVADSYYSGEETILIVEDDNQMRDLLRELLESMGYEVIEASTGIEALEVFRAHKARISLVILDLIMPQMGGRRCLEQLLEIDPDVKVLIASGYSDAAPPSDILDQGARAFVNKPYDIHLMLKTVRDILDAA